MGARIVFWTADAQIVLVTSFVSTILFSGSNLNFETILYFQHILDNISKVTDSSRIITVYYNEAFGTYSLSFILYLKLNLNKNPQKVVTFDISFPAYCNFCK